MVRILKFLLGMIIVFIGSPIVAHSQLHHVDGSAGSIVWSEDGTLLGVYDDTQACFYTDDGLQKACISFEGQSPVTSLRISPFADFYVAGHENGSVSIGKIDDPKIPLSIVQLFDSAVIGMAISPDGSILGATSEQKNKAQIWWLGDLSFKSSIELPNCEFCNTFRDLEFNLDGTKLALLTEDTVRGHEGIARILIWSMSTGDPDTILFTPFDMLDTDYIEGIAFAPNGKNLVAITNLGSILRWNIQTGELIEPYLINCFECRVSSFTLGHNGEIAVASNNKVWIGSMIDNATINEILTLPTGRTQDIAFSPTSGVLASLDYKGEISLWNIETGDAQQSFTSCLSEQ